LFSLCAQGPEGLPENRRRALVGGFEQMAAGIEGDGRRRPEISSSVLRLETFMAEEAIMIRGIHHVAINVHDFDRMLQFYTEAFGFEPTHAPQAWRENVLMDAAIDVKGSAGRAVMLRAGTCYLELFEYAAPEPSVTTALRPFDKGYTHFCLDVTDIADTCERLKAFGMTFHDDPVNFGPARAIYGRDPEGNIIEIQELEASTGMTLDELKPLAF
jgi:catechol 2,3-dioxygenase-like lactoylglutathione lyase family enzyme